MKYGFRCPCHGVQIFERRYLADAETSDGYAAGYTAGRRDAINEAIDLLQANKAGRSS